MRSKKGFTLVELLTIISVTAVLVAMILPSIKSAKETARRTICASNLRQIGTATHSYAAENEGKMPSGWGKNYSISSISNLIQGEVINSLGGETTMVPVDKGKLYEQGHISRLDTFFCPSDRFFSLNYGKSNWDNDKPVVSSYTSRNLESPDSYTPNQVSGIDNISAKSPEMLNHNEFFNKLRIDGSVQGIKITDPINPLISIHDLVDEIDSIN